MSEVTLLNVARRENSAAGSGSSNVLRVEDVGDGVVRLVGELDMATAPILLRRLEDDPAVTVLDLREVTFIDSSGLSVLVWANRDRESSEPLTLRAPTAAVCRVLEVTGLVEVFRIDPGTPPPS